MHTTAHYRNTGWHVDIDQNMHQNKLNNQEVFNIMQLSLSCKASADQVLITSLDVDQPSSSSDLPGYALG